MADIGWAAISGGSQVVRKSIEILASQNWTAPVNLAGNTVYVTASGGGGSGGYRTTSGYASGGFGGCYCVKQAIQVSAGATYLVTVGSFGAGVAVEGSGSTGGATSFSSLLSVAGGSGGKSAATAVSQSGLIFYIHGSGISPELMIETSTPTSIFGYVAQSINGKRSGMPASVGSQFATGGACGYFGNGTDATASGGSTAAATANSGAGSGATSGGTGTGNGGSGKMIIEWDEFL